MKIQPPIAARGFTLLEVMIAVFAFCTATFAILALVSQSLDEARHLQRPMVDAGLVASAVSLTNSIVEGSFSGDLGDLLGDTYRGYPYNGVANEVQTNHLYEVDITILNPNHAVISQGSFLFYRPQSVAGSMDGATVAR